MAWLYGRVIESRLFGVPSHDPLTYVAAVAALVVVSLAATAGPARGPRFVSIRSTSCAPNDATGCPWPLGVALNAGSAVRASHCYSARSATIGSTRAARRAGVRAAATAISNNAMADRA